MRRDAGQRPSSRRRCNALSRASATRSAAPARRTAVAIDSRNDTAVRRSPTEIAPHVGEPFEPRDVQLEPARQGRRGRQGWHAPRRRRPPAGAITGGSGQPMTRPVRMRSRLQTARNRSSLARNSATCRPSASKGRRRPAATASPAGGATPPRAAVPAPPADDLLLAPTARDEGRRQAASLSVARVSWTAAGASEPDSSGVSGSPRGGARLTRRHDPFDVLPRGIPGAADVDRFRDRHPPRLEPRRCRPRIRPY